VTAVRTSGDRVAGVELGDGEIVPADVVVVAAGAWSATLLAPLGVRFPVRAERVELLVVDAGTPLKDVPVFSDLVSLQYVRIEASGQLLAGNSDHSEPEYADPDHYANLATDAGTERAVGKLLHRFPGFPAPAVSTSYAGCYDVTPDYNPVISPVGPDGLLLAAGFSGHGFKISPAVGSLVADLVLDGASNDPDIDEKDFRLSRFDEGKPLQSRNPYSGAGQMR
jgi:sarcosine oxidase subunit beta